MHGSVLSFPEPVLAHCQVWLNPLPFSVIYVLVKSTRNLPYPLHPNWTISSLTYRDRGSRDRPGLLIDNSIDDRSTRCHSRDPRCIWYGQLQGPNPYPILGETGLRKHTLFQGNLTIPGTRSGPDSENILYFRENLTIPGTRSGPDSENIPYFRENLRILDTWSGPDSENTPYLIWWNHTLF